MHPGSQALSVPDFYPPKAGQIEEDMSEVHVKHGIQAKQAVSNEGFSCVYADENGSRLRSS